MTMKLGVAVSYLVPHTPPSTNYLHVEHGDTRKGSRVPLLLVVGEGGVERVGELSDDRNGPLVTGKVGLLGAVDGLLEEQEGQDDGQDRRGRRLAVGADTKEST